MSNVRDSGLVQAPILIHGVGSGHWTLNWFGLKRGISSLCSGISDRYSEFVDDESFAFGVFCVSTKVCLTSPDEFQFPAPV